MSVILGMIAALAWGIHDLCVRQVSQNTGIFASIIMVLAAGCILVLPVTAYAWDAYLNNDALYLGLAAGCLFGLAAIAHYKAFSIGPVKLVAPIIGSYPALSVGWAVWQGTPVSSLQWFAVIMIIFGVGYVAGTSAEDETNQSPVNAIFWSVLAGLGFASTFAVGQAAAEQGGELPLLFPTRFAALITVLVIALALRIRILPGYGQLKILAAMGALDAIALGCVLSAGGFANPELASVLAATFGLITILLAAIFLRERMTNAQWGAVVVVFACICYLAI
jgi:drug/metabolite transporter (DMT)-like permease